MPTYHNGSDGKVKITPPGGNAFIEAAISKWDMAIKGNNRDVSNSKDGRKRIRGVQDASGNLSMFLDTTTLPPFDDTLNTGLGLRDGAVIQLELIEDGGAGGTDSFRCSGIIDEVKPASEFDGDITYDVTWSLESGTVKYPGDA